MDEIVIDDGFFFYNQQELNVTNVKDIHLHTDSDFWYTVEGDEETKPIMVFAFTQSMSSTKAIRIEGSILTVLAKIGGIMNFLNKGCTLLTAFMTKYLYLAKQLRMLTFNTQDYKKSDEFLGWKFQCQFFCFKRCCCSSTKRCRVFGDKFYQEVV